MHVREISIWLARPGEDFGFDFLADGPRQDSELRVKWRLFSLSSCSNFKLAMNSDKDSTEQDQRKCVSPVTARARGEQARIRKRMHQPQRLHL